ncbi:hypothetical protein OH492_12645 [Vibrio chagasii]|nr:hypothetical protein [Vibrio chagasii]
MLVPNMGLMAGTADASISTQSAANSTIDEIGTLISNIGEARMEFGANINRLGSLHFQS